MTFHNITDNVRIGNAVYLSDFVNLYGCAVLPSVKTQSSEQESSC